MGGISAPGGEPAGRRNFAARVLAIVAIALVLAASGAWYVLSRPAANTPPHSLAITVSPLSGDNTTLFSFTVQLADDQDNQSKIQVRWDWENDTIWDTAWDAAKIAPHRFSQPGNYSIRVQAKDTGELTTVAFRRLTVDHVPFRLGVVLPITGVLSIFGGPAAKAINMAVAEINAAGGVYGESIQVFHEDDQTLAVGAQDAATRLITTNKVVAIIGSLGSASCLAMLPVIQSSRVFEIAPGCTSPIFSNASVTGGWFARTAPSDALQGAVEAWYARVNLTFARSGVMGLNSAYGAGIAASFAGNFTRLGGTITSGSPRYVSEVASDYTADLHAVLDVSPAPEVVYVAAYPSSGVGIMRSWWNGLGANPSWRSVAWHFTDGNYDQASFIDPLVSAGVDVSGFRGTVPAVFAGIPPPRYAAWASRYQTIYGTMPSFFAADAYDATYLVALAAQAAGFPTGTGIRAQIRNVADPGGTVVRPNDWGLALRELGLGHDVDYAGASGSVDLDARGDVVVPYVIWAVNSTNGLYAKEFFPETLVASILPPGAVSVTGAAQDWPLRPGPYPRKSE